MNVRTNGSRDVLGMPAIQDAVFVAEQELAGNGRVLLRPSGTEPLLRVMVEGSDAVLVESLAARLADLVREQAAD